MTQGIKPNIRGFAMPDNSWLLGLAGMVNFDSKAGLTAATTQTQAAGTQLAAGLNGVTSVANASDACVMPSAQPGSIVLVANNGGNVMNLFPAVGDKINDAAVDAAVSVADNTLSVYICTVAGTWYGGAITFET